MDLADRMPNHEAALWPLHSRKEMAIRTEGEFKIGKSMYTSGHRPQDGLTCKRYKHRSVNSPNSPTSTPHLPQTHPQSQVQDLG